MNYFYIKVLQRSCIDDKQCWKLSKFEIIHSLQNELSALVNEDKALNRNKEN